MIRRGTDRITKLYSDSRMTLLDGSIQIPCDIQLDPSRSVSLAESFMVASWDTIDDSNNPFLMAEKVGSTEVQRIATIAGGPYD